MKLSHYLLLGLAAMFAAILVGAQLLYVNDTRNYLEQQLEAHAEETATSLALALGNAGGPTDRTLAETVVRPVFDRGQFRRIEVRDVNGASIVRMELGVQPSDAPAWFVSLFAIDASGGEALISSGWKQSGRVTVEPLPALAYRHLWEVAQSSAIGLAVLFALAVGLSMVFLNFLLRSLDELEAAARDLGNRVFREISLAPRARELQSLVNAFNVLTAKIRAALEYEESRAQQLQHEAFSNSLTGLLNRRGIEQFLQTALAPGARVKSGYFGLMAIEGLADFRATAGFERADDILREVAELLRAATAGRSAVAAYINEGTFAWMVAGLERAAAEAETAAICRQIVAVLERNSANGVLQMNAGGVCFEALGQNLRRLLADADLALSGARSRGHGAHEIAAPGEVAARGSLDWRALIERALSENRISLLLQRVVHLPGREPLHREITVRLDEAGGETVPARLFMPMTLRHGFGARLDLAVLQMVAARLQADSATDAFALNVTAQSLGDPAYLEALSSTLRKAPAAAPRLIFEIAESTLRERPDETLAFAQQVRAFGCRVGLDNFFVSGESLKHLNRLLPSYVKLAQSYNPETGDSARFVISSLGRITRPLDVQLIVLGVEHEESLAALSALEVNGVQGYAIDMPTRW